MNYNYGYYGNQANGGYQQAPYNPNGSQFHTQPDIKEREKKRIARISSVVALAVIGFSVLAFVLSFFVRMIPGFLANYNNSDVFQISFNILFSLVIIGVPFLYAYLYLKKKKEIGILPLGTPRNQGMFWLLIPIGLAVCIVGSYVSTLFGGMLESFFNVEFEMPEDNIKLTNDANIIFTVIGTALIPAVIEEFSVRGVVMQSLKKYGDKFAILMSALIFALMHGNMVQIPFAFIAGIAIGYAVLATGTMWTGIVIHFLNNFVVTMMQVAYDNFPERNAAVVTMLMAMSIILVGVVCAIVYYKKYFGCYKFARAKRNVLTWGEKTRAFFLTVPMVLAIGMMVYQTMQYIHRG